MSGGSFNYAYSRVQDFNEALAEKIRNNDIPDEYGDVAGYPPEVLVVLNDVQAQTVQIAALMKAVEWLYSGDYGPETFLERVAEHLAPSTNPQAPDGIAVD
ncbi:hypothetical protein [Pseudomonas serbica]|jgi:hypothetical protein|uniref:hypothetical protein n=1 Tax=Pseudomonas serbica TaxID=2965074 RepID=UPI00237A39B5|nr:hypothetical protein [Pseudomonas serbica]